MGKYTLVGCNPDVGRYPLKDWRRMKRSGEARCHAGILRKKCRLVPVTYRECALRQTYEYELTNPWVDRSVQDCSHSYSAMKALGRVLKK